MRIDYPRWSHALAAGLLLLDGCKSNKDAEPTPKAQAAAPAPTPAAPAPVPTLAPVSDATLSYVEELPDMKCRWVLHTPPSEPKTLTITTACPSSIGWKPDGKEALVADKDGLWRVDLATGYRTQLPSQPPGELGTAGYDAQGRTVALMEERSEEDPISGQAHAFRLQKDGTWKRFETKEGADFLYPDSGGYHELEAVHEMAPATGNDWDAPYKAIQKVPKDSPDFAALSARQVPSEKGVWEQLETVAGPLYFWKEHLDDEDVRVGPVLLRGEQGLVEPEGLSVSGSLDVAVRGDLVLLRSSGDPGKYMTRMWNAKTKQLLATLSSVKPVSFWPRLSPTPVRNVTPAGQLAIAFRTVYGSSYSKREPPTFTRDTTTYELRPAALEWVGDTAVLLTLAEDSGGCHGCNGAMSIHYLKPKGAGLAVKGSWPLLVDGSSFGQPPSRWRIRRDLGRNPFLTTEGGFSGQGQICESMDLTELAPGRPIPRGHFFTHYEDQNADVLGKPEMNWTGTIAQPVPDLSFDVVYTGSESFTEHYQRQGEEYRHEGESRFKGYCE